MYRIFTLSPGSTSTKFAVFEDTVKVLSRNVTHDPATLGAFRQVSDQLPYRMHEILSTLDEQGIKVESIDAFSAYSGGLQPMEGGIYRVNEKILADSRSGKTANHPAVLGAQMIAAMSERTGSPSFLVNPPDVDEFEDSARITGIPGLYRESHVHVLNQKEIGARCAAALGKKYEESNLVVAHIGGGLSVTAQKNGRIIDANDVLNGDGPMAPNRSGSVPAAPLVKMAFSGRYTERELLDLIGRTGGLKAHLGTDDTLEIKRLIREGDRHAERIYRAMAYQLSKFIGAYAVVLKGCVDAIALTGGVSRDEEIFVPTIRKFCEWIAPVLVFAGDFEMEALAAGAIRALSGEETVKEYTGIPVWDGFHD